jgi:hypothetical protein
LSSLDRLGGSSLRRLDVYGLDIGPTGWYRDRLGISPG